MSDVLILKDGTEIKKGDKIQLKSRSYIFVERGETSECLDMGDSGVYKFLYHTKSGIVVSDIEMGGTIFVYTGPDRVMPSGLHMRKPEITLPRVKKLKGVKRKKKTIVEMAPSIVGTKVEPPKKKRGRPAKTEGESSRKAVGAKSNRGRPKGSKNRKKGK